MEGVSKNRIKYITALRQKKYRDAENAFVVEGVKMVEELLTCFPEHLLFCIHTPDFDYSWPETIEHYPCDERTLKQCSSLQSPNKVLAVVQKFVPDTSSEYDFQLALDGVQDPGNMGTLLRLADWYGISSILCSHDTVDIYNPKVVQASMGSVFRVKVTYTDLSTELTGVGQPVYGALLDGENVYSGNRIPEGILVLGNEGKGISGKLIPLLTHPLTIPGSGRAESLNVSVAGAILISEFFRGKLG